MKTCKTDFSPSKKMWNKNSWKLVLQIFLKHFGSSPQNQVWKFYNGLYSRFSSNPRSKTGLYNLGRELNCTCPLFNPLTPVPPVTGRDEPWPFFHFWRHHFWPKLASSILNFCRRKRSLQWCPDQSDWPNGAWDMHKNAQKVEWKTHSKISFHYTWLLHDTNCPSRWRFLRSFQPEASPAQGQQRLQKKRKGEKDHFLVQVQNFDFCAGPSPNVQKRDSGGKKGKLSYCKCIFHQIKADLAEIQPENHQNVS